MSLPPVRRFKLTPEQKRSMQTAQERLAIFEKAMNDARQANLDVSAWEEKYRIAKSRVEGILRVYSRD
jgi:hypothetical protein